ncbi:MAG: hypothetical protein FD165_2138 [Gammaproteobacteria bacterium]|nr:MAG: hypothetical protein FD165_2138 [Gammaproteobacteria bacterium]TND05297.1 MAG: hypothetical protein FD120_1172 [Gammaproteobacteria bacterium]
MPDSRFFHQKQNVTSRIVDDETILVGTDGMQVHQLNRTASFVWGKCDGVYSVDDIVEFVIHEFEVEPEVARNEVVSLIAQLQELDLLVAQ